MSNVIAKGVSSNLTSTEKDTFRSNVAAASQSDMGTAQSNITELSTANNARTKTALNATGSAPVYACRAWGNFDGTGGVTINAIGNIASIIRNSTGNYTVTFTDAMPNRYSVVLNGKNANDSVGSNSTITYWGDTLTKFEINCDNGTPGADDFENISFAIFC